MNHPKDFRNFKIKKIMNLPDIITFLNLLSGVTSIFLSLNGKLFFASIMLFVSMIFDYLDGKIATILNQKSEFGRELDSLSDLISFGVAPAILGFAYVTSLGAPTTFLYLSIGLFLLAGSVRLAQYNTINYHKEFIGMPITANGILLPLYYFLALPIKALPFVFLASAILMVSNIKIKRPI